MSSGVNHQNHFDVGGDQPCQRQEAHFLGVLPSKRILFSLRKEKKLNSERALCLTDDAVGVNRGHHHVTVTLGGDYRYATDSTSAQTSLGIAPAHVVSVCGRDSRGISPVLAAAISVRVNMAAVATIRTPPEDRCTTKQRLFAKAVCSIFPCRLKFSEKGCRTREQKRKVLLPTMVKQPHWQLRKYLDKPGR